MTLDELKTEADKLGYRLVKKSEHTKHVRCVCGGRGTEWFCRGDVFISCSKCDKKAPNAKSISGAWRLWYDMMSVGIGDE